MMSTYAVEFVGGPLDGHTHPFDHSPDLLSSIAGIPVSADLLRFINGQSERLHSPASSVAVYQLQRDGDDLRYFHLCSVAEQECELEDAS